MATSPMRKSIGFTRFVLARLKKGQAIRSCASRAAMSLPAPTNRSSCPAPPSDVFKERMVPLQRRTGPV
jgi:hypothetical protein